MGFLYLDLIALHSFAVFWWNKFWANSWWSTSDNKLWLWCTNWWIWYVYKKLRNSEFQIIFFFSFLFIPSRIHNLLLPGILRQPKWGHLKDLHAAIKLCESALTAVDGSPQYVNLGPKQEVCANLWFKNLHFSHLLQPWFLVDHLSKLLFFWNS